MEDRHRKIQDKKDKVRRAVESNTLIDTALRRDALELQVGQVSELPIKCDCLTFNL